MAVAVKEPVIVTPNKIAQGRARAVDLCAAAYAAQAVQQPDGSTLALCWNGRIARGYERLAAARGAKETAKVEALTKAIRGLEAQYNAAADAAERAAADWAAMAASAGVTVDAHEVYPPQCQCEGCAMQRAYHDHNEARGAYSDALYALLAPNPMDLPPLLEMLEAIAEEAQRDRLWTYMQRIRDTGRAYIKACEAAGTRPNWRAAMWPGGEE